MAAVLGLVCLMLPFPGGDLIRPFAPEGAYAGHWGVDLAAPAGSPVSAPLDGRVSFAGSVAGMRTVTIEQGPMKVSLSYLGSVGVGPGTMVTAGDVVGTSGRAHGLDAVHLSVRLNGDYVDPAPFLGCRLGSISDALRLVPYPGGGANRNSRRDLRSAPSGSSPHGRGGPPATGSGRRHVHAGGGAVAEGRPTGLRSRASLGDDPTGGGRCRLLRGRRP